MNEALSNPLERLHEQFLDCLQRKTLPLRTVGVSLGDVGLDREQAIRIFESQLISRQLDRIARIMQARGQGFYTIGSAGHEGMAGIAAAFRLNDMAFLHYRDASFLIQRARMAGFNPMRDLLLSFMAAKADPIAGGRHKVLGHKDLFIPPQTSTIASHLPKAVGAAFSIGLARKLRPKWQQLDDDGVILCSFGDASLGHASAQSALNTASWTAFQAIPMPILFICEDNGIGISTPTPAGWIKASCMNRPGLHYLACDGLDLAASWQAASIAERIVRRDRKPVFLHLRCVRLGGHAGADHEEAYRSSQDIADDEARDPLLTSARLMVDEGLLDEDAILARNQAIGTQLMELSAQLAGEVGLGDAKAVMASIVPPVRKAGPGLLLDKHERDRVFGRDRSLLATAQPMARLLNWALRDLMARFPELVLAGQDIGAKGGVYHVTKHLQALFGQARVIDTVLDETSMLGLGIGLAHNGFVPIIEIQFLAYLHNGEDQLRGEAASLSFFSKGQFTNPMIIRIAGLGYQKGFGGHFHNDNSIAVLRDIPGLVVACPSNGADAILMLQEAVRLARAEQRIVVFLEPIALYHCRDLHESGDQKWSFLYPNPDDAGSMTPETIPVGCPGRFGDGTDLAIVSYGNGYYLARKAAKILQERHGLSVRVIDLRWLVPLDGAAIVDAVGGARSVLVVDECRRSGSVSEGLMTLFAEHLPSIECKRVTAEDSFIALGQAATVTLPDVDAIVKAAQTPGSI